MKKKNELKRRKRNHSLCCRCTVFFFYLFFSLFFPRRCVCICIKFLSKLTITFGVKNTTAHTLIYFDTTPIIFHQIQQPHVCIWSMRIDVLCVFSFSLRISLSYFSLSPFYYITIANHLNSLFSYLAQFISRSSGWVLLRLTINISNSDTSEKVSIKIFLLIIIFDISICDAPQLLQYFSLEKRCSNINYHHYFVFSFHNLFEVYLKILNILTII